MIKFSDFMNDWLYGEDGYYSKYRAIGKGGDFYTAVSSSIFFGGSIANRFLKLHDEGFFTKNCSIIEIGAHQGYMLADIVQFIYTFKPKLLNSLKFIIIEPYSENIKKQIQYFKDSFGDLVCLHHYPSFENLQIDEAFIVSNEIFDAFGCEIIKDDKMLYMDGFKPVFKEQTPYIRDICKKYDIKSSEIGVGYEEFVTSIVNSCKKFEFVTFDYGDLDRRLDYSIRVYHKHNSYPFFSLTDFVSDINEKPKDISLEQLYKKSDITYDVDFRFLIDIFKNHGVKNIFYKTQMAMLVEFGIIDLLDELKERVDSDTYLSEVNRVKVLIDPSFMGERFKGLVFTKG